jgi:AcrR family transcriptional regulator
MTLDQTSAPAGPTLRRDQADAVRQRVLSAAIRVIENGGEPTMRSVAQEAQIAERTLYRHFPSRDDLQVALIPLLNERVSAPMAQHIEELPDYIERLFTAFSRNAVLARALTRATWVPTHVSRSENLRALRKLIDASFPDAPQSDRKSAAASLRVLYSAAGWVYLTDCGCSLAASITHVRWVTKTVLDRLCQSSGGNND